MVEIRPTYQVVVVVVVLVIGIMSGFDMHALWFSSRLNIFYLDGWLFSGVMEWWWCEAFLTT